MPFPETRRVIYKRNPLDNVICQLRFPPILKIDAELPAQFQELIRQDFPTFNEKVDLVLPEEPPPATLPSPEMLRQLLQPRSMKNYSFVSEDDNWTINLTRTFLAISTNHYKRWEEFKSKLEGPRNSLEKIYEPSYFTRIGLRYIDVIKRSTLGLANTDWNELLNPAILGILSDRDIMGDAISHDCTNEIKLEEYDAIVRVHTQLVKEDGGREFFFLIDSDFFKPTKTMISEAIGVLNFLNSRASRLIQWCITEKLQSAMEPEAV